MFASVRCCDGNARRQTSCQCRRRCAPRCHQSAQLAPGQVSSCKRPVDFGHGRRVPGLLAPLTPRTHPEEARHEGRRAHRIEHVVIDELRSSKRHRHQQTLSKVSPWKRHDTTPDTTPGFYLKQHVGRAQRTVSANTHPIKERLPIHYRSCRVVPKVEPTGVRAAVARRSRHSCHHGRIPGVCSCI